MKIIQISLLILVLFVAQGCNKEGVLTEQTHQATLLLKVASGVGSAVDPENQLNDVRVFSFHTSASTRGLLDVNSGKQQLPTDRPLTQAMRVGVRDIYVMANEGAVSGLTDAFDGIRNLTDLTAIRLPYEPLTLAPPFVSTYKEQVEITKDGATQVDAKVVRTLSKVVLTLSYEWGYGKPMPPDFIIHSVQVKNLPEYSYLISQRYDGTAFTSSREVTADELVNQSPTPNSSYQSKPLTIYIPEFIGASSAKGNHAYLEIVGYSTSRPVPVTSTYRMSLSSNMAADGTIADDNYDIARNTSFTINGTINGEGEVGLVFIEAYMLDWDEVNSTPEEVGDYLKVPSAIEIEYGEDFKLNIQASHAVTLTKTNPKITMTQVGKVITLRSDDMDTKVKTPNYDKITVKMGSMTKEIQVNYRPHPGYLMDKWNLTANANGITSTQGEVAVFFSDQANYGSYFKYGSVIPIKCYQTGPLDPMYKPTDALWLPTGVTRPLTYGSIPSQNSKFVVHTLDGVRAGKGDPCRLMGLTNNDISSGRFDNGRWRLPTIKELKKIGNRSTITNAYWRNITEPEATDRHARYRYSDKFELFFPLAGASGDNGIAVITPRLLHTWGMWQANSMALESGSDWYDAMSTNNHLSPSGGAPPFVVGGGSPLTKGHSVRCIKQ